jgi:sugar-specific transcriptional regulator TrmB
MQILELAAKLQTIGFTDKQAKVYVAALFLGPSPVQKIAQQANVNRATTYVILDELMEMGLVSESNADKKTVYVAEPPEAIERFLDSMQKGIQARRDELKNLMPDLLQMQRSNDESAPTIRFYKVDSGFDDMNDALLRKAPRGSQIYAITNADAVLEMFDVDIAATNPPKRIKKNISSKLLVYSTQRVYARKSPELLRETKLLARPFPSDMTLYENSALIFSYSTKKPIGIVIEDKDIVTSLRQLFEAYWDSIK